MEPDKTRSDQTIGGAAPPPYYPGCGVHIKMSNLLESYKYQKDLANR